MEEFSSLLEQMCSSEPIFDGCVLHVRKDTVALPNGKPAVREYLRHGGAVCIVPLLDDGRVLLERQFRYPMNEVITEIPAGKKNSPEEDARLAAARELREETGARARELISLGDFYPACAYSSEVIEMFLARGITLGEQELDEDEFLNVFTMPLEELVQEILAGKIPDAKTQAAVLRAWLWLKKEHEETI